MRRADIFTTFMSFVLKKVTDELLMNPLNAITFPRIFPCEKRYVPCFLIYSDYSQFCSGNFMLSFLQLTSAPKHHMYHNIHVWKYMVPHRWIHN